MTTNNKDIIFTRRGFFRQLSRKTLPFLSFWVLGSMSFLSCGKEDDEADCKNECKSSCFKSCSGSCEDSCAVGCTSYCGASCTFSCLGSTK